MGVFSFISLVRSLNSLQKRLILTPLCACGGGHMIGRDETALLQLASAGIQLGESLGEDYDAIPVLGMVPVAGKVRPCQLERTFAIAAPLSC